MTLNSVYVSVSAAVAPTQPAIDPQAREHITYLNHRQRSIIIIYVFLFSVATIFAAVRCCSCSSLLLITFMRIGHRYIFG